MNGSLFQQLKAAAQHRFRCSKCSHRQAAVDRIAVTGAGLSRFLDIQNRRLITVSCTRCGFTEVYNERAITGKSYSTGDIIDFILGG